MMKILITIEKLFTRYYKNNEAISDDFKKGFSMCLYAFRFAIKKSSSYNYQVKNLELQKELKEQKSIINNLKELVEKNIDTDALYNPKPLDYFVKHEVYITDHKKVSIVTNISKDDLRMVLLNFIYNYQWTKAEDFKIKLIRFINSKESLGYKAFRDYDVAKKQVGRKFRFEAG